MQEEELDAWEEAKNFTSLRTVWKRAQAEWSSLKSESEVAPFVEKYSDILKLEDRVISPLIKSPFYRAVCNRDGIFATAGGLTKISGDYYLNDSTGNYLKLKQAGVDTVDVKKYAQTISMDLNAGDKWYAREIKSVHYDNWHGCFGLSRRLCFVARTYNYIHTAGRQVTCQHKLELYADPYKIIGWGCWWDAYPTEIQMRNLRIEYYRTISDNGDTDDDGDEIDDDANDEIPSFTKHFKRHRFAHRITNGDKSEFYEIIDLSKRLEMPRSYFEWGAGNELVRVPPTVRGSVQATSRGLGGHWITLNLP